MIVNGFIFRRTPNSREKNAASLLPTTDIIICLSKKGDVSNFTIHHLGFVSSVCSFSVLFVSLLIIVIYFSATPSVCCGGVFFGGSFETDPIRRLLPRASSS